MSAIEVESLPEAGTGRSPGRMGPCLRSVTLPRRESVPALLVRNSRFRTKRFVPLSPRGVQRTTLIQRGGHRA